MISYEELSKVFDMDNPLTLEYFELCDTLSDVGEVHHILPRSMFPEYIKALWNLVKISHRDHYKAHEILPQIVINDNHKTSMLRAWYMMCSMTNGEYIDSVKYEELRLDFSRRQSARFSGEKHPQFGKPRSQTTKRKLSIACLGRKDSLETVERKRAKSLGRTHSQESRKKMSESMSGLPKSEAHKKKLSDSITGRKLGPCKDSTKTNIAMANRYLYGQYTELGEFLRFWDSSLDFIGSDFNVKSVRSHANKTCIDGVTPRKYKGYVWRKFGKKQLLAEGKIEENEEGKYEWVDVVDLE